MTSSSHVTMAGPAGETLTDTLFGDSSRCLRSLSFITWIFFLGLEFNCSPKDVTSHINETLLDRYFLADIIFTMFNRVVDGPKADHIPYAGG